MPVDRSLLTLTRLPARLNVEQTALILGFQEHDIQALIRARLLKPLGSPQPNSVKYFCSLEILESGNDRTWLDKATRAVAKHWKDKGTKLGRPPDQDKPETATAEGRLASSGDSLSQAVGPSIETAPSGASSARNG